jgi:type I restriction enzyme R subunit
MDDEIAFYDVREVNDSAVKVLSDETLRTLVRAVKSNLTIDWTVRENVRAQMYLAQNTATPDKQEKATPTVLEQAELLATDWAA